MHAIPLPLARVRAPSSASLTRRGQIQMMRLGIPGSTVAIVPQQCPDTAGNDAGETLKIAMALTSGAMPTTRVQMPQHLAQA